MNFIRSLRPLQSLSKLSQVFDQTNINQIQKLNLFTTEIKLINSSSINNMSSKKNVDFDGLLEAQKDKNILIIDVREKSEIDETGKLPGSIHIPMANVANQLENMTDDDFKKQYQISKPTKETKIVLSCRSGMRSGKVQEELQKLGYKNSYNYTGGWSEWENKKKL